MRALIGLGFLVSGALVSLEHFTQQNPALLVPLWTSVGPADAAVVTANKSQITTEVAARPAVDSTVATTVAVADANTASPSANAPAIISPSPANKTADVIVPPVKRIKPITPPAEPVAVVTPEVKAAAVGAVGAVAVIAAAKSTKVFAGKSALGGPVPPAAPSAAKSVAKPTKQVALKTAPATSVQKRPGFKLTCTSAQKLDVEKQRCVPIKGKLATVPPKPKA